MSTLVFVIAFCIVAVLVYMARYSGRVRVEQTRLIDAPLSEVYARVADFRNWPQWSPWLEPESETKLTFSGNTGAKSSSCSWDSARMGAGAIEHVRLLPRQRIDQRLRLRHPFTVSGRSYWTFKDQAGKTEVTWHIRGRVAFSMRAFALTVKGSLALDCRYGLDRLASLLEPADAPRYSIVHLGLRDMQAMRYVYRTYQGTIKGLAQAMRNCIAELRQQLTSHGVQAAGMPIAVYFKTNIKLRTTVCHFGIPVDAAADPGPLPVRELAAHRAYVVSLHGSHQAAEIAWYQAMQRMVAEKIQPDQRLPPFESYLVNHDSAAENDYVTELHIPVLRQ
jgi:uncharacterized protein YndB with AHSA1/START domain